jgi:hypothetical protein
LRASSSSGLFERARSGDFLGDVFVPSQTGAEGQGNPERSLWVDKPTLQHAFFYDPKNPYHRFNEVVAKGGRFRCRRTVARLGLDDTKPVETYGSPSLYLVFLSGDSSKDSLKTREVQREFLILSFEDATADLPVPIASAEQGPMDSLLAFVFARDVATAKAYLPEAFKKGAARRGPADEQLLFENWRFAESFRAKGWKLTRRGKPDKPELVLEGPGAPRMEISFDKERIEGEKATLPCRARVKGKEPVRLAVGMLREAGRWRVGGVQKVAGEDPPGDLSLFARLDDPALFDYIEARDRESNEKKAISDLRNLVVAQAFVATVNGGFYLPPECLESIAACIPGYTGGEPLEPPFAWTRPRHGYRWMFHPGPRATRQAVEHAKAGAASLQAYAFVGLPETPGRSGNRAFCGDASWKMCATHDGSAPAVKNGVCAGPCSEVK